MKNRRTFLQSLAAQAAVVATAAGAAPRNAAKVVGAQALPAPFDGWEATFIEVTATEPGSPPHTHAGFVLGYVVDGEFRFQVAGEAEKTLRAGETFYEAPGAKHVVSSSAQAGKAARVLAIIVARKAETLTKRI